MHNSTCNCTDHGFEDTVYKEKHSFIHSFSIAERIST